MEEIGEKVEENEKCKKNDNISDNGDSTMEQHFN